MKAIHPKQSAYILLIVLPAFISIQPAFSAPQAQNEKKTSPAHKDNIAQKDKPSKAESYYRQAQILMEENTGKKFCCLSQNRHGQLSTR